MAHRHLQLLDAGATAPTCPIACNVDLQRRALQAVFAQSRLFLTLSLRLRCNVRTAKLPVGRVLTGTGLQRCSAFNANQWMVKLPFVSSRQPSDGLSQGEDGSASQAHKILIADDNIDAGQSLAYLLRAYGHEVQVVENGLHAISAAFELRPDIIILDIAMPTLDGYETARRLRAHTEFASTVLIALTGYSQEPDRRQAERAGFDHHFAKPLDIDCLLALLKDCRR